jgi:hypothetical protein
LVRNQNAKIFTERINRLVFSAFQIGSEMKQSHTDIASGLEAQVSR